MRAKITADHLERTALVYVRQSTPSQVRDHLDLSPSYAGLLLKRGIIPGTQAVPGSIWWVDPAVLDSPARA